MALKIRLRQQGRANRQTYRLVVTESRNPRDGKYIEMVGWYDPMRAGADAEIKEDRIVHWMEKGAVLTHKAKALVTRLAPDAMKAFQAKRVAKSS